MILSFVLKTPPKESLPCRLTTIFACVSLLTCVLHVSLINLHLVSIMFGEGSYYIAFSNLISSSLLGSDIILGTFSQTSFNVRDSFSLA